jgi:hypothetical protein
MADEVAAGLSSLSVRGTLPSANQPYFYHQLKGQSMIRLLELQPAKDQYTDELAGRLIDTDLLDGAAYEAISYTWGNPVFDHTLRLPDGHLMITENLASALRRFRSIDPLSSRLLWADQVCINQADTLERNQQVSIMGEIYMKADRVLTWLGTGDEDTNIAVTMLKEIASSAESCGIREATDGIVYFQDRPRKSADEERALHDLAAATDFARLKPFYQKPWFSRVWISQEVALPPQVDFFCGADEISFGELAIATSVVYKIGQTPKIQSKFPMVSMISQSMDVISLREIRIKQGKVRLTSPGQRRRVDAITRPKSSTAKDLDAFEGKAWVPAWNDQKVLDYVATVGYNNLCYDDRDRVYAISLCSDNDVEIKPDYGMSVEEVYTDFAKQCLTRQEVRILHYAGLAIRHTAPAQDFHSSTFDFPSWASDWRARRPVGFGGGNKQIFTAGFGINILVRTEEHNPCIDVAGAFIDVIEAGRNLTIQGYDSSRPLDFSFEPSRKSILGLREFFNCHRNGERYSTGETSLTAFARTVTADLAPTGSAILKSLLKDPQNTQELVNLWLLFEKTVLELQVHWMLDAAEGQEYQPFYQPLYQPPLLSISRWNTRRESCIYI